MKLTQEQLDAGADVLHANYFSVGGTVRESLKLAIEAATGESVEIVEPEPEIPDEAVRAATLARYAEFTHREFPGTLNLAEIANWGRGSRRILVAAVKTGKMAVVR